MLDVRSMGQVNNDVGGATPFDDGDSNPPRLARRKEQFVQNLTNGLYGLAEEGSLFIATTPTPGTGITGTPATGTTYSSTQATLLLYNGDLRSVASGGKRIYLDAITLVCTAAGTAGTLHTVCGVVDAGFRYSSGGTQLIPANLNWDYGAGNSIAKVYAGVVVGSTATSQARQVGRANVRIAAAPAYIVGDVIRIKFGSQEEAAGGVGVTATTAINATLYMPPVILGPNSSFLLLEWMSNRTAAQSFEYLVTWVER